MNTAAIAQHLNVAEQAMSKPKKITYTYPTGQKVEMVACVNNGFVYKIYVDGQYHGQQPESETLSAIEQMTAEQRQSAALEMIY
jgi:hypothetical protein